jgi:uncharacterized protein YhaN
MTNVTFSVDDELNKRMKSHPEIKWSEVCRQAILKYLEEHDKPTKMSINELRSRLSPRTNQLIKSLPLKDTGILARKSREADRKRIQKSNGDS